MSESLKSYIQDNLLRGQYVTADESPLDSPLQFILWLSWQQVARNNRIQVIEAANGE